MRDNILATLVYYDIFDFPLRAEEVLRYLIKLNNGLDPDRITLGNVKKNLDQLVLDGLVNLENNYYFLYEKIYLAPLRIKREKISREKWIKAKKAIRWLRLVPYVQAVFASGSLALNNCDELSDLDVLIVVKHGRIWLTRFLVSGLLSLVRARRRYFDKIAPDKICLNHYITDQSLRIPFESMYNAQNYINLKPILIKTPKIINDFFKQNSWIGNYIYNPNPEYYDIMIYHSSINGLLTLLLNSRFGNWLEKLARAYQIRRIAKNPLTSQTDGHIVFNDEQLSFHPDSPEKKIFSSYEGKLNDLIQGP